MPLAIDLCSSVAMASYSCLWQGEMRMQMMPLNCAQLESLMLVSLNAGRSIVHTIQAKPTQTSVQKHLQRGNGKLRQAAKQ